MLASNIPAKVPLPFANSGTKNTIPTASQIGVTPGAASLTDGFPPLTFTPLASGGVPPAGADFNGLFNLITAVQQWQCAGGVFRYDATFSTAIGGYPKGSVLNSTSNDTQWLSIADANTTNPDATDGSAANWISLDAYGITTIALTNANVTLTPAQWSKQIIIATGTLTGNVQLLFPAFLQKWQVINNTTGAFTLTAKTVAGTGSTIVQGGSESYYGDGTNLVGSTGNTPPQFDNSTKLATTAFLQRALGNYQTSTPIGTALSLTALDAGKNFTINVGGSVSMPLGSSVVAGSSILFGSTINGATISRQGSDVFNLLSGSTQTVITLNAGDTIALTWNGTQWAAFGGSAQLGNAAAFAFTLTANGYQKLPSGVIIQRGTFAAIAGGDTAVTFPIAFPNGVRQIVTTAQVSTTGIFTGYNTPTITGFNGNAWVSSASRANANVDYIAIGN
jgi:hypothetical protein